MCEFFPRNLCTDEQSCSGARCSQGRCNTKLMRRQIPWQCLPIISYFLEVGVKANRQYKKNSWQYTTESHLLVYVCLLMLTIAYGCYNTGADVTKNTTQRLSLRKPLNWFPNHFDNLLSCTSLCNPKAFHVTHRVTRQSGGPVAS